MEPKYSKSIKWPEITFLGKHMKQIPSPPFWGGVRVKKWSPFFDLGAQTPIFGHPNLGTFDRNCQKCPYPGVEKWDFKCPNPKKETTFSRQHPLKMVEKTFVLCVYHFWKSNRLNLKKCTFWTILSRFSLSTDPKIEMLCKMSI